MAPFFFAFFVQGEDRRREVAQVAVGTHLYGCGIGDEAFAEELMSEQPGCALWMSKVAEPEDYHDYGCTRDGDRTLAGKKDITEDLLDRLLKWFDRYLCAMKVWRECYEYSDCSLLEELTCFGGLF